jgi:hypothetical protein
VTEFVAFALDRALGIGMVPSTAVKEFTHEQFLSLFHDQVQPELDLKQALETDPLQRTGILFSLFIFICVAGCSVK